MISNTKDADYKNSPIRQERFENALDGYVVHLQNLGCTDSMVYNSRLWIRKSHRRMVDHDPYFDVMNASDDVMETFGTLVTDLTEKARNGWTNAFGRFVNYVTGRPIFQEKLHHLTDARYRKFIREHPEAFEDPLHDYMEALAAANVKESIRKKEEVQIRRSFKMLFTRYDEISIHDIDESHLDEMDEMNAELADDTRHRYKESFGKFVNYARGAEIHTIGSSPRRDYRGRVEAKVTGHRFETYLRSYVAHLEKLGYRWTSIITKVSDIVTCMDILENHFPGFPLELVDIDYLLFIRNFETNVKESTMIQHVRNFSIFVEFVTNVNPMKGGRIMWNKTPCNRLFIQQPEWKGLWKEATLEERVVLALAGGMGLRRMEIAEIRLSDIRGDTLRIRGKGHGPKGKEVDMEIPEPVMEVINEYIVFRQNIIDAFGDRSQGHLIVKTTKYQGDFMTPDNVADVIKRLSKRAHIKTNTHSFRRLFAMTMYDNGVDLNIIRNVMRHSNVNTTLECYIEADPRKCKDAKLKVQKSLFE